MRFSNKSRDIEKYLNLVDEVLVLTVNPGRGGQKMLDSVLYKVDLLIKMRKEKKYKFKIIVDGGVNDETIDKVRNADIIVSGSYICQGEDFNERIAKLKL